MTTIEQLRESKLFYDIDVKLMERLATHSETRTFRAGEHAWRQGDTPRHFIVVQEGIVAIQQITADGTAVVVSLFGPHDALCIAPTLQRTPLPADAVAMTDKAVVLMIAAEPVLNALGTDPRLAAALNHALLAHTAILRSKIEIVSAGTVPRRIAALLLHLAGRFGRIRDKQEVHINPALTREQIGQMVNARTETVIRIMSRWAKAGWIQGGSPTLAILRSDMLRRIACGAAGMRESDE